MARKVRIIYLLTNNCNSERKEEARREIKEDLFFFSSRTEHIFSEYNTATFEMNIWMLFV